MRGLYRAGSMFASETLCRTTKRKAVSSLRFGVVRPFKITCKTVSSMMLTATLESVRATRRLFRSALRQMKPGIVTVLREINEFRKDWHVGNEQAAGGHLHSF